MTVPEPTGPVAVPAPAVAAPPWWAQYAKSLLALAGATPPAVVFSWLEAAGVHALPGWAQLVITAVCSIAAVLFGPKNAPKV